MKLGPGGSLAGSAPKLLTKAQPLQNGLAVAAGGSAIYWVNETAGPTVLSKFNPVTGTIATFPAGPHPAGFLVAGAINPLNGWYYFGSIDQSTGILHIYAFNTTTNTVVGEVGTVQFPAGTLNVSDFVFDGLGNLFTSYDNPAGTVQTLVRVNEPIPATAGSPSLTYSPLATLPTAPLPGSTGIAFGSNGNLYINTQTTFYQVNPVTGALLETGPTPSTTTSDNASCSSSGSVTLKKDIVGRSVSTDQFNLAITGSNTTGNTGTTSGSTTGLQTAPGAVAGPVIARSGATLALSEAGVSGTNLNNYQSSYQCTDQTGTVLASGSGTSFNLTEPPPVNGVGAAVTCIFTNTPKSPNLVVSKSVDPVAGTMVQPGQVLTYTLTFDNTSGTAPAPVAYTDWLGDVLDDSTLVGGSTSSTTTSGTALVVANNASAAPPTLGITGTVAAGATSTVTYQVTVNSAGNLGDASLENYLTPSTVLTPPTTCPAGSTTCTVNPVGSWSLAKTASPASGTAINPGDPGPARTITYTVTATNSTPNAITGVILTDDLSQVLNNAVFTAGSAKLTINGWSPVAVADPGAGNALVTSSFTLPGNGTAVLSYSVTVNPTAWLVTLKNGATGNGLIPPVRCVTGSAAPLDPACITTNPTTGHLFVQKAGPGQTQGSTAPLTGSTFEIHNDAAGQMGTTVTGVSSPVTGSPGLIEVQNLAPGTYWLLETKAPNGYSLLATPVKFALAPGGTITLDPSTAGTSVTVNALTITVTDVAALKLPTAGGPGATGLWRIPVLGVLLLMASLALLAYRRAKKPTNPHS
ncbi:SpaA isopeptide-forming pilin-related protein [Arthrobacter sp. NA-172]|uniref:DUF7927 domain-containing protein n=1 Tax=Arthrobacter sp. NA-172 TaxID=3367524 RepID=UPI0037547E7F